MTMVPLKVFTLDAQTGPFGSQLHADEYIEGGVPVINPSNIKDGVLVADTQVTVTQDTAKRLSMHRLKAGDLVFARRGELGRSAVVSDHAEGWLCGTGALRVRVDPATLHLRYAGYALQSAEMRSYFARLAVGSTMANLNTSIVLNAPIPNLSQQIQHRIADFLDAEITRIDHIAELRHKQLDLLISRRWSHFQEALDAAGGPVIPLRRVMRSVIDGPFGSAFSSADYIDEGAAIVRLGNIGFAEYRPTDQAYIPMSLYRQFRYHQVSRGDLLIAGLGDARNHAGRACVAPDLGPAIVKGKCFRARLETETADADFIALLLSSPVGASAIGGRGSTRSMINLEILKAALLPIPEPPKQRSIVSEHRQSWKRTKAAVDACERQLALLAERRQALITAAVTGQFDVTTASGRNVTEGVSV
jgi:type I restriction enzyme S subunit